MPGPFEQNDDPSIQTSDFSSVAGDSITGSGASKSAPAPEPDILSQIEEAILALLRAKVPAIKHFEVKRDAKGYLMTPAAFCHIDSSKFKKLGQITFRADVEVFVTLAFQSPSLEVNRRRGIYPIVLGVLNLLMLQDLDLSIHPLQLVEFGNITGEDERAAGLIVFQMQFKTWFDLKKMSAEDTDYILRLGMEHLLRSGGDQQPIAEDSINLQ